VELSRGSIRWEGEGRATAPGHFILTGEGYPDTGAWGASSQQAEGPLRKQTKNWGCEAVFWSGSR